MEKQLHNWMEDYSDIIDDDPGIQEVFSNASKGVHAKLKTEILKCVFDALMQYCDEGSRKDILDVFKHMFADFSVVYLYESKDIIDIHLHLFSYVSSAYDPFLPNDTAKNFVESIIQKMLEDTKNKRVKIFITFQING